MAFLTQRFVQSALKTPAAIRKTQLWDAPDLVTLPVRDGVEPCGKPAVRIFLGTEPAQYKAERIFIWSIEQVRDPARVYEIYLMKNLKGFDPRFWLTGFTNYRFAIPHFAGGRGRAIFNDVDQIYLKDPAELFDLPMNGHGYLAIDAGDISVALLDCEKMARIWSLEDARARPKNELLARAKNAPGLWGRLDGGWNARDREFVEGESGVLHYTALHRQPWHPFPRLFAYQKNPHGDVWYRLEDAANEAGFRVFSAAHPSQGFRALRGQLSTGQANASRSGKEKAAPGRESTDVAALLQECRAQSLLHCRIKSYAGTSAVPIADTLDTIRHLDPVTEQDAVAELSSQDFDAVVCEDLLECIPDDDMPWLLEQLFTFAGRLLYCRVDEAPARARRAGMPGQRPWQRTREWWHYQFETVARHHPHVRWRVRFVKRGLRARGPSIIEGNETRQRDVRVWALSSAKLGHSSQTNALAEMIGWPYEKKQIRQSFLSQLPVLLGLPPGRIGPCRPPWPDVVIGCGWWPSYVARWIRARSGGRTRLLLAGRKSGGVRNTTDIIVCCEHYHLPAHRRRIETLLPVHPLSGHKLDEVRERTQGQYADAKRPRVALLVGGDSQQHAFSAEDAAAMGKKVMAQVRQAGGSLFVVTARRTSAEAAKALEKTLAGEAAVHVWTPGDIHNPYLEYLANADIIVVTGESESMLTDAIATHKPVYIYPLRKRRLEPVMALGQWLWQRSSRRPRNRRGTERPQQGFEYLCARLLQLEWVVPPRDIEGLHRRMVELGYAEMFGDSLQAMPVKNKYEQADLGGRLRRMLEQPEHEIEDTPAQAGGRQHA